MIVDEGLRRGAMRSESDPLMKFFELVSCAPERDAAEQPPEREDELGERNRKRETPNPFVVIAAKEQQRKRAEGREEDQDRKERPGGHQRTLPKTMPAAGQKKMTAMMTSAPMTTQTA